ncbi:MAG: aminotransferase class IV [Mariprofundales bacterium]|nr:aminotransferase class IV [Mariprofundales bacterium]
MNGELIAYVNGTFLPLADASVHIEDRGFQFADGVYEVVACFGGAFLDLDLHIARLQRSLAAVSIALPSTPEKLVELLHELYSRNPLQDAMLYIQVTRGVAARAHLVGDDLSPTLVITARQLPSPSDAKLTQVAVGITLADIRWQRCDIKSIALLASVMGKQEARRAGADEAFWIDGDGHLLEGCATNILAVIDGVLVTHPLDRQVLGGITRQMVLNTAGDLHLRVEERPWCMDEAGLSECMLTSTTNAVLPICVMDGRPVGSGAPGEVTLKLRSAVVRTLQQLSQQGVAA